MVVHPASQANRISSLGNVQRRSQDDLPVEAELSNGKPAKHAQGGAEDGLVPCTVAATSTLNLT